MSEKVKLLSVGITKKGVSTKTFRTTTKNKKKPGKIRKKCYDPRAYNNETGKVGMHIIFEETKL